MSDEKKFRCPHCGHSRAETVPHRRRCPKCGREVRVEIPVLPDVTLRRVARPTL